MRRTAPIFIAAALVVAACGGEPEPASAPSDKVSASEPAAPPAPSIADFDLGEADFLLVLDAEGATKLIRPEGARIAPAEGSPFPAVALSGVPTDATSRGLTGGVAIRMPDALEDAAGGKAVVVRALARSAGSPASLGLVYSTNEAGTSGWKTFTLTDQYAVYELYWPVPAGTSDAGDFVGLKPFVAVDIAAVTVSVVERRED